MFGTVGKYISILKKMATMYTQAKLNFWTKKNFYRPLEKKSKCQNSLKSVQGNIIPFNEF